MDPDLNKYDLEHGHRRASAHEPRGVAAHLSRRVELVLHGRACRAPDAAQRRLWHQADPHLAQRAADLWRRQFRGCASPAMRLFPPQGSHPAAARAAARRRPCIFYLPHSLADARQICALRPLWPEDLAHAKPCRSATLSPRPTRISRSRASSMPKARRSKCSQLTDVFEGRREKGAPPSLPSQGRPTLCLIAQRASARALPQVPSSSPSGAPCRFRVGVRDFVRLGASTKVSHSRS